MTPTTSETKHTPANAAMGELLALMERNQQLLETMQAEVADLRAQLAVERRRSQVLFARVNSVEMN